MAHFAIAGNPIAAPPLQSGLYLVATPIGNLGDVTLRALATLGGADLIACEDTRVTGKLLRHYAIRTATTAYHEHNAAKVGPILLEKLKSGARIALASDAGTPLISDPGYRLVAEARAQNVAVFPVPGPSAPVAALVASGLQTDSFLFAGFLPTKRKARRDRLHELGDIPATLVLFESPNRLTDALDDIAATLGADRNVCVARELTKLHEETRCGSPEALAAHYRQAGTRGEIVLVIAPPSGEGPKPDIDALLSRLLATETVSRAAQEAARQTGASKRELYARALALSRQSGDARK